MRRKLLVRRRRRPEAIDEHKECREELTRLLSENWRLKYGKTIVDVTWCNIPPPPITPSCEFGRTTAAMPVWLL